MGNAGLILLVPVLLGGAIAVLRWAVRRRATGRERRASDEVRTVLAYTAPGDPGGVQRAVVAHLGLPTRAPSAFDPVTYLQTDGAGGVVIAYGTVRSTRFTGSAAFSPAADGGTAGSWGIRRWTTQDGSVCPEDVATAMLAVRTAIADAVRAVGGTADVHVLGAEQRLRR